MVYGVLYFLFCTVSVAFYLMNVRVCAVLYAGIVCTACCVGIVLFIVWCLLCVVWYWMIRYCMVRRRLPCLYPVFVL